MPRRPPRPTPRRRNRPRVRPRHVSSSRRRPSAETLLVRLLQWWVKWLRRPRLRPTARAPPATSTARAPAPTKAPPSSAREPLLLPEGSRALNRIAGALLTAMLLAVDARRATYCPWETPPSYPDATVAAPMPPPPDELQALPTVPETVWADSGFDFGDAAGGHRVGPRPRPDQKRPPCYGSLTSKKVVIFNEACWIWVGDADDCPPPGVAYDGRCYHGQPKMEGPPVSGHGWAP